MTGRSNKKVRRRELGLTTASLKATCWANGYRTVTQLSKSINRSRTAIYGAVRDPEKYPKTLEALEAALTERGS